MTETGLDIEGQLKQARAHMYEGRFDAALQCAATILQHDGKNIDGLYIKAVCERYLGHTDNALMGVELLKSLSPDFGRAYQEEGHIFKAKGDDESALAAYRRACQCNPSLQASWNAQADIFDRRGQRDAARDARGQAQRIAAMPKPLVAVSHLLYEGKLVKAENACRHFLQNNPHNIEAMRLLADIGSRLGILEDADFLLESALEFEPDNIQVRIDYIQILRKRQKFSEALKQSEILYQRDPENAIFQSLFAIESMQTGDYDRALDLFEKVLLQLPDDPVTLTSKGHALKTCGRHDEAVRSYQKAFQSDPGYGDAYYGLANLKTYRFSDEELALMELQAQGNRLSYQNRIHICFALGKAYEDRKEYDTSFGYYDRGNELKRVQSRYDADQMTVELQAQITVCTPALFEKQAGKGHDAPDPIFILGLPRAGSTLLEQILASHSQIDGTLELPNILSLAHRLRRGKQARNDSLYPEVLHDLDASQLRDMGRDFIDSTRIHRQGAPYFIDKMPNNFRHIGLIKLILPKAKIIDARREPMACCFSGFKQLFAEGQEFTYGLDEIGRYYRDYVQLMAHWDTVLPGAVLRVQHEDVLDDLEGQVNRMLDYLGLPFEQGCIDFHQTERAVRTASSEQVRQPITKASVDLWRHYQPHLQPLKDALENTAMEPQQ
ncbi:sulfotransferase [uncultured Parasphingorhabdus sp.]|uniref:tetratricopeptide repeat-containing sulfotransferase family protein n=1 Tax=uncultured Parasphingorhabdus sp. TaxID=2709694 RepID=UPI0030DD398A|tara:strand:+ start:42894 stop:44891 length:1998 start_codon:yes stop_codon:yes gene_type:complete